MGLEQAPKGLGAVVGKGLLVGFPLPASLCQLLGKGYPLLPCLPVCVGLPACGRAWEGQGYRVGLAGKVYAWESVHSVLPFANMFAVFAPCVLIQGAKPKPVTCVQSKHN